MSTDSSPKSSIDDHIHIDMLHELDNRMIIEENNVNTYTDQHFIHKLNEDLEILRMNNGIYESNSPIIMSNENSDNSDDELDIDYIDSNYIDSNYQNTHEKKSLKKLTFREVKKSINKYYEVDDKYSNELDILTTYLKGQKNSKGQKIKKNVKSQIFSFSPTAIPVSIVLCLVANVECDRACHDRLSRRVSAAGMRGRRLRRRQPTRRRR
jgi:hypothetical protein